MVEARTGRPPLHVFVSGCASPSLAVNGRGVARWATQSTAGAAAVGMKNASGTGALCGTAAVAAAIADITAAAAAAVKVSNYPVGGRFTLHDVLAFVHVLFLLFCVSRGFSLTVIITFQTTPNQINLAREHLH